MCSLLLPIPQLLLPMGLFLLRSLHLPVPTLVTMRTTPPPLLFHPRAIQLRAASLCELPQDNGSRSCCKSLLLSAAPNFSCSPLGLPVTVGLFGLRGSVEYNPFSVLQIWYCNSTVLLIDHGRTSSGTVLQPIPLFLVQSDTWYTWYKPQ